MHAFPVLIVSVKLRLLRVPACAVGWGEKVSIFLICPGSSQMGAPVSFCQGNCSSVNEANVERQKISLLV